MTSRWIAALVLAVASAGCSGDPATVSPPPDPSRSATAAGSPTASPGDVPTAQFAVLRGRVVAGPTALTVRRGDRVRLDVRVDAADEVHVHGYDVRVAVTPHEPVRVEFDADTPGVFEIELESSHLLLCRLRVTS